MKAFLVILGITVLIYFKRITTEMLISINQDFFIPLETIAINCTSLVSIESNISEVIVENEQVVLVLYQSEQCQQKPGNSVITDPAIPCKDDCSCSLNGRSILFHYNVTSEKQMLEVQCAARDLGGKIIFNSSNIRKAISPAYPSVNVNESTVSVEEGNRVGPISCAAVCIPDCTYRWTGPGFIGNSSVFQFDEVVRKNEGKYTCEAKNILGTSNTSVQILVLYGPKMVKLTPLNQTYTIEENLALGPISCAAQCNPECTFSWIGPGITFPTNELHISTIQRTSSGQFTCTANNSVGTANMSIDVIVRYGAEVTLMNISSSNENVTENTTLNFICEAVGVPKPTVKWFYTDTFGDSILISDNNHHMIQSASCLDTGKYTCFAENEGFPPRNYSQEVNVTCIPRLLNNCSSTYERILAVKRNETKNLYACFLSNPPPRTNWTKHDDNTSLNIGDSKSQIYKNSTLLYTAVVEVVLVEQNELNVTVNAENYLGTSSTTSFRIRIKDRPLVPKDVRVICEGENVIHWFSNYNGGSKQNFRIRYTENNGTAYQTTDPIIDKGPTISHHKVLILKQNTYYSFVVMAINSINSTTSDIVSCITRSVQNSGQNVAAIGGGTTAGLLVVCAIVMVLLYYRRQLHARTTNKEQAKTFLKKTQIRKEEQEDTYSLKNNPIYDSQGYKNDEYSIVSKHRLKEFENTADLNQQETGDIYINHVPMKKMSKKTTTTSSHLTTNKDGLNYADLDFAPCGPKFVIRGIENKSKYAIIDRTKTAEPLPSSDEDDAKDVEKKTS